MRFYKTTSIAEPAEFLAAKINQSLREGKKVLWLIPGGSAIAVAVAASMLLDQKRLDNLSIILTDERYGEVGHPASNAWQLQKAGIELRGARFQPLLIGKGAKPTAQHFALRVEEDLEWNDFKIGLFGMGTDGHIAGIKPDSPAVASAELVQYFSGDDFERITITPTAIARLDAAVVYAVGTEKYPQLDRLQTELPVADQPAQILKDIADLTIFSDYTATN